MRRGRRGPGRTPPPLVPMGRLLGRHQNCESCGNRIERRIVRRILAAHRRGYEAPMLCRSCFIARSAEHSSKEKDFTQTTTSMDPGVVEWICVRCNALLEPEEVEDIRNGKTVECEYCGAAISRELFK